MIVITEVKMVGKFQFLAYLLNKASEMFCKTILGKKTVLHLFIFIINSTVISKEL